jgi:hypothetical protein
VWEVDQGTISANRGSRTAVDFDEPPNAAPRVVNPPPKQEVDAGTPLSLALVVEDDGNPRPRVDRGATVAGLKGAPAERPLNDSLRVSWVQWRGPGIAKFDPRVIRVVDGKATTKITFDKPGNYVLRVCGGCEHPHASRRQRDRPPASLILRMTRSCSQCWSHHSTGLTGVPCRSMVKCR